MSGEKGKSADASPEKAPAAKTEVVQLPPQSNRATQTVMDELMRLAPLYTVLLPASCKMTVDQMRMSVLAEMNRSDKLRKCSPASILSSVSLAVRYGLKLGLGQQCFIIPRYNKKTQRTEAVFQIGYRGLEILCRRSGRVSKIEARVAYAKDDQFVYEYGTTPFIKHVPTRGDRGELSAAYAVAWMPNSAEPQFEVLEAEDVAKIRAYSDSADMSASPWKLWPEMMWRKSAIIRLCKQLPSSEELEEVITVDYMAHEGTQDFREIVRPGISEEQPLLTHDMPFGFDYETSDAAEEVPAG